MERMTDPQHQSEGTEERCPASVRVGTSVGLEGRSGIKGQYCTSDMCQSGAYSTGDRSDSLRARACHPCRMEVRTF